MSTPTKSVVIVGGGFGGVYAARHLQRRLCQDWQILLFSQENHFIFTPLLGDVVGSSINPMHVVCPIRQMAPRALCRTATVTAIDLAGRAVVHQTAGGGLARQPYDHLVLACGAIVNLDIIPGMAAHGLPLKTMGDALLLRNHLIGLLERAEVETDPSFKRRLLSVVVVGGGFSGVEVTGEIADLLRASARFYHTLRAADIRVTLLEARDRILPDLPASLSAFAQKKMTRQGIAVRTRALARSVTERGIHLQDGSIIESATVVCTIGTTASPLIAALGLPMQNRRIKTESDLRLPGQTNVWALGDCAAVPNAYDGTIAAPTAQIAVRQGKQLADNLLRTIRSEATRPFSFKPLGMLASIGHYRAVGLIFGFKISGFPAWFIWRGVYLSKMPTLARKIQIAFDWLWQLFFPRDIVQLNLDTTERLARAHFEPGQFVFHKGEAGDKFYIVERGRAGVYLDESAAPVAHLKEGDHFGEGALLHSAPRSASVRAEEPLDVLVVGARPFGQLAAHLTVLRSALDRSVQGSRSAARLLELARDDAGLSRVPVRDVMSRPVETLAVDLALEEALRQSRARGRGAYPVVDPAGNLVGLVTRTDFYNALQALRPPETPLAEVMRQPVRTVRESDTLAKALMTFLREPIKRLVVVADDNPGRVVGMVTPFDILQGSGIRESRLAQERIAVESHAN